MLMLILEAAIRSLLMAATVWAGIRVLHVRQVLAQKVAWVLVLTASLAMPGVMRAPLMAGGAVIRIPMQSLSLAASATRNQGTDERNAAQSTPKPVENPVFPLNTGEYRAVVRAAKPSAGHRGLLIEPARRQEAAPVLIPAVVAPPVAELQLQRPPAVPSTWVRIGAWLTIAYLIVAGGLLFRLLGSLAIAFRIWLRAVPVYCEEWPGRGVRVSSEIMTPVTVGSSILLPTDYQSWDADKLRIVMAHELSHVRQGDFYIQLLAGVYAALFWFSPLGWWLQRRLSELGEALSDRAGLAFAPDAPAYAQVLLDFAAMPRRTPIAGVAMAHTSNLSSRIERILNENRFRLAFLGGRRHAAIAALLVPAALIAAVSLVRVVPRVEAAQAQSAAPVAGQVSGQVNGQVAGQVTGTVEGETPAQGASLGAGQVTGQLTPPPPPAEPGAGAEAPEPPEPPALVDDGELIHQDGDEFAIVHRNPDGTLRWKGEYNEDMAKALKGKNIQGDYILFKRDGKTYIIQDPAILAQSRAQFKGDEALQRAQAELELKMAEVQKKMEKFAPEIAKAQIETPEFKAKMAELDAKLGELQSEKFQKMAAEQAEQAKKLAELQSDEFKKLTKEQVEQAKKLAAEITQEKLAELDSHLGEIQGQIGELQGLLGEKEGEWGEKQGLLGEQMGKLGEEMGRLGEQQGKIAEEASRKLKALFDQAIKDGKAKPVQ